MPKNSQNLDTVFRAEVYLTPIEKTASMTRNGTFCLLFEFSCLKRKQKRYCTVLVWRQPPPTVLALLHEGEFGAGGVGKFVEEFDG
jgi:hypothetical protein